MPPSAEPLHGIVSRVPFNNRKRMSRYGSAVAVTILATVLTYIMWAQVGSMISPLFLIGVLFVAWYGGLRPGLLCALLSVAACNLVFAQPSSSLSLGADDLLRLATFMIGAVFVSSLTIARHQ